MLYTPTEILLVGAIMTFGSTVQGAVGFASGILGVPLLILSGFSLPEAATINLVSSGIQNLVGAWKLRYYLEPRELILPVILRWLGVPVGTYSAWTAVNYLSPSQSKQLIGCILLTAVIILWLCRSKQHERLNIFWQILTFTSSGFMMGFATIGGPPMVLYVNSLTWSVAKSRAFLFFCSATALPIAAIAFSLQYGAEIIPAALATVIVLPVILTGLWAGLHLGHHLSKPLFRKIAFSLIVLIALAAIVEPLFH